MSSPEQSGLLFVLSGPSGVGKDAAIDSMKAIDFDIYHAITATTREMRPNERDGQDYYFYNSDTFRELLRDGEFLESALVHRNRYGTPRKQIREQLALGHDVLLKIDVQGARQVKARVPDAVFVFLAPPSIEELVIRLKQRRTETAEQQEERVQNAYVEMQAIPEYDYVVVNHHAQLETAVRRICCIINAERCRVRRRAVVV